MCSVQFKTRVAVKSRKLNNNVVHKTTSETIRLERPETLLNNNLPEDTRALSPIPKKAQQSPTSSFQITGISVTQRCDFGEDSADESHTDDISRITDNETPSFSEDTCSREAEDNISGLNSSIPAVTTTATNDLLVLGGLNLNGIDKLHKTSNKASISSSTESNISNPANRFPGSRFKVVKLESNQPFKRGRWTCTDYPDDSEACNLPLISNGIVAYSQPKDRISSSDEDKSSCNPNVSRVQNATQFASLSETQLQCCLNKSTRQSCKLNLVTRPTEPYSFLFNETGLDEIYKMNSPIGETSFSRHFAKANNNFYQHLETKVAWSSILPLTTSQKVNSTAKNGTSLPSPLLDDGATRKLSPEKNLRSLVTAVASLNDYHTEVQSPSSIQKLYSSSTSSFTPLALLDSRILHITQHALQKLATSDKEVSKNTSTIIDTKIEQAMVLQQKKLKNCNLEGHPL